MSEKRYTTTMICKELNMNYQKVSRRFNSKYSKQRWGVSEFTMPDGSIKKYVPESKLYLWKVEPNYIGRPVFRV